MIQGIILVIELTILFFLSRTFTQKLYTMLFLVSHSRPFSISIVTLLLFPGTVIHELAHLFTAEIFGVRTGKLILTPEAVRADASFDKGDDIQVGSVTIGKTGPFRRTIIGLAPLLWGIGAITAVAFWLQKLITEIQSVPIDLWVNSPTLYLAFFTVYLLFSISNSLFPSKIDMQGSPAVIVTVLLLFAATYIAGIRISLSGQSLQFVNNTLTPLVQSLGFVLAVNVVLLLIVHTLLILTSKIKKVNLKF